VPAGRRRGFVQPLAPAEVERLRGFCRYPRDATLIGVLAYAGLRPGEALALRWSAVRDGALLIDRAASMGVERPTKTGRARIVPLVEPLRADLEAWQSSAPSAAWIFPSRAGALWTDSAFRNWRRRRFYAARDSACADAPSDSPLARATPYTPRHSAASLWLRDPAMSPVEVAEAMGHSVQTLFATYAHVIAGLRGGARRSAGEEIAAARAALTCEPHVLM
jgi:integrase